MSIHATRKVACLFAANGVHQSLQGAEFDVERMAAVLVDFEIHRCVGSDATHDNIVQMLWNLVATVRPGDLVVIYFSGHGGLARFREPLGVFEPERQHTFWATADHDGTDGVFNGVLDVELHEIVVALLRVSPNIVVITDACHAGGMFRAACRLKSIEPHEYEPPVHLVDAHPCFETYDAWLRNMREHAQLPWVVTLCAAPRLQSAYEVEDASGVPGGALTIELCAVLQRARAAGMNWLQLAEMIYARLVQRGKGWFPRPHAGGPCGRRIFSLDCDEPEAATACWIGRDGALWIGRGRLHGTRLGDVFVYSRTGGAVLLEVDKCLDDRARVAGPPPEAVADGVLVYPRHRSTRVAVHIESGPETTSVRDLVDHTGRFRTEQDATLTIAAHPDGFAIREASGPVRAISRLERVLDNLHALEDARSFVEVCNAPPGMPPEIDWDCRLMRLCDDSTYEQIAERGAEVAVGDRLWLDLINRSTCELPRLYVNVVARGVSGRLTLLNGAFESSGVEIGTRIRAPYWQAIGTTPLVQVWPSDVPRDRGRTVTWYVIASTLPIDLHDLGSKLEPLVAQWGVLARGNASDVVEPVVRWACRAIEFTLRPRR